MKKRVLMILSLVLFLTVVSCDDDFAELENQETIEQQQNTEPDDGEDFPPGGTSSSGNG